MTAFIRQLEAPLILERAKRQGEQDGFFWIPALAGGLDYSQVGDVIDSKFRLIEILPRKFDLDP